jgi:hypothetical protein
MTQQQTVQATPQAAAPGSNGNAHALLRRRCGRAARTAVQRFSASRSDHYREYFDPVVGDLSTLLSIKTGGCEEDCAYCLQSMYHQKRLRPAN